jgi:vacuolar-type H+-ATPase subunit E/Vma4
LLLEKLVEKVGKRLKNINENPNSDDVLKNTLDKQALCKFNQALLSIIKLQGLINLMLVLGFIN